jgi:hypothetical protein
MKHYKKTDISEAALEDLVRQAPGLIEDGLVYVDHQKIAASGRLDVILVDSGKSLVVAELKVVQDDGMLLQGIDYYDYVSSHIESYARLYKHHGIDPTQQPRLFLVAPSFSQTLVNRCKWIDLPIFLYTFNCLKFDGDVEIVPIFSEHQVATQPEIVEITNLDDHLGYITDAPTRAKVVSLLDEIKGWKPGSTSLDPVKQGISIKVNGRVFAYFHPRRKYYLIATYNSDDEWTTYPVKDDDDLAKVKPVMRASLDRRSS